MKNLMRISARFFGVLSFGERNVAILAFLFCLWVASYKIGIGSTIESLLQWQGSNVGRVLISMLDIPKREIVAQSLAVGVVLILLHEFLAVFYTKEEDRIKAAFLDFGLESNYDFLEVMVEIIRVPTFEEFLFRGLLMMITWAYFGPSVAIPVQAIGFASPFFHKGWRVNPRDELLRRLWFLIFALVCGVLVARTESIWSSVIAHSLFMAVSNVVMWLHFNFLQTGEYRAVCMEKARRGGLLKEGRPFYALTYFGGRPLPLIGKPLDVIGYAAYVVDKLRYGGKWDEYKDHLCAREAGNFGDNTCLIEPTRIILISR